MSSTSINLEALSKFKSRINYPLIQKRLPNDRKRVLLDWWKHLDSIVVDGEAWIAEDKNVSILFPYQSEINALFEKGENDIDIDVHLFGNHSNNDVLDEALIILSRTSMYDINAEYDTSGPCDVYLYEQSITGLGRTRAICVFRNVIIEINSSLDNLKVRRIVESFYMKMNEALVEVSEIKGIDVKCIIPSRSVYVEQEFYIEIVLPNEETYKIKLHQDFNDNIELIKIAGNKFYFRAQKQGLHNISFSVMDQKSLVSSTVNASIAVIQE